jgi:hypothetical protein
MTFTLDKYMPYTIGFDSFFNSLDSLTGTEIKGYPHYNIMENLNQKIQIMFIKEYLLKSFLNLLH